MDTQQSLLTRVCPLTRSHPVTSITAFYRVDTASMGCKYRRRGSPSRRVGTRIPQARVCAASASYI
ncbi:hypothetical protein J6590_053879 [Homalodisca vitripennis]|nr:hypothetical protein J6590_053879 [Homalodisca vitripennis]